MQAELDKVVTALTEFYGSETWLFEHDLGERTLTHRLAVHLEKQFPDWKVDCNYDRLGERTLRLPRGSIVSTDDHLAKSICDRGAEGDQSSVAGTRSAQAARDDRPASVVRLRDRNISRAGQEKRRRRGLCRWRDGGIDLGLARGQVERRGTGIEMSLEGYG